jgi:class 3 adenylate cyclase/tetratricopeptide (TPR) repeat protein
MKCPRCQTENDERLKFCEDCGAPLARACPNCGAQARPGKKFCGECGSSLDALPTPRFASPEQYTPKNLADRILLSKAALEGERKQVTVLFADIKGSMELLADRDPEEARELLDPILQRMMEAVHRYEGTVNQVLGDGIMALFGAPLSHEDHAVRGCHAALLMQMLVNQYVEGVQPRAGTRPRMRIGLNSGEVVVRSIGSDLRMDYSAIGQTTHLASRMEQMAMPGSILIALNTFRLAESYVEVRRLGPIGVRGLSEPVEAFELIGMSAVRSRMQAMAARGLAHFVGRTRELEVLAEALPKAADGKGQVIALMGEPGVGKSRLVWEFTRSHREQEWLIVDSGCVPYGKATAYLPVIDMLRAYFRIEARDDAGRIRERVVGRLLPPDSQLESTVAPILSLLDVPVEDSEWEHIEPPQRRQRILDACKRLLLRESQVHPLLLVFEDLHWIDTETQAFLDMLVDSLPAARVLLLVSYRPEYENKWTGKTYCTQLRIDPLTGESAEALLEALLGGDPSLVPLKQMLNVRTEGNPLFIEETVRAMLETQVLRGTRGDYRLVVALDAIQVPVSVQAVLSSRIDRLAPEDKRLLQTASVIGKNVPLALLELIADASRGELQRGLAGLQQAEFVYETKLFPDLEYSFKHALTHEVAYGSLLHERRRTLHAQLVEAIEHRFPNRLTEYVDQLARHAFRGEAWGKAVHYLRESGARGIARSAYVEALANFEAALAAAGHLPADRHLTELMVDIRFDIRGALWPLGELDQTAIRLREAQAYVETLDDPHRLARLLCFLTVQFEITGDQQRAIESGRRAVAVAAAAADRGLEAVASLFLGQAYYVIGDFQEARSLLERAINLLQGDLILRRLGMLALPSVLARAWLAWALAEVGEFDTAQAGADEAVRIAAAVNQPWSLIFGYLADGVVCLRKGEIARATSALEGALDLCRRSNVPLWDPFAAAHLGYAYQLAGRAADAHTVLTDVMHRDATGVLILGRALRVAYASEACLRVGQDSEALALAARSLELSRKYGERGHEAWTLRCHADIHAHRNSPATAGDFYQQSLRLADMLGMRPLVAHCHLGLGKLHAKLGDRTRAREHLETCLLLYRQMKMQHWPEQAENLLASGSVSAGC